MKYFVRTAISLLAFLMAAAHQLHPEILIYNGTLCLLGVAILPWILPAIKSVEVPGVGKIELADTKAATDKVTRENIVVHLPVAKLQLTTHPPTIVGSSSDPFDLLRTVALEDSNLALAGFRIEIEKKLRTLAETVGLHVERKPLSRVLRELHKLDILSSQTTSGLTELIALCNRAVHGAEVSDQAVAWVLDVGPAIALQLEEAIRKLEKTEPRKGT